MATPSYLEKTQSQLPALQLLIQMGWTYLTPKECNALRNDRLGEAILEPLLSDFMKKEVTYEFKGRTHSFTENAIQNAVQALKGFRAAAGSTHENEQAYDLLCLGTSVPQTVDGDTKSFTIPYIDWKRPEKNQYHCTAEYKLERIGHQSHYIPDIVLFVNGIPLVVIECKRSAYTDLKKSPIDMAVDQLDGYQQKDGIPQLFLTSQLLLALARDKAEYGTNNTPRKFWSIWKESGVDTEIRDLITASLPPDAANLYEPPFAESAKEFRSMIAKGRAVYEQDLALYALCRPQRLLDLIYKFLVYDNGIKKVARYQQYFTVRDILGRVHSTEPPSPRPGGVVWHTQGSGKSLTMVMLAKSLALDPKILSPKIILVTDRIALDDQICDTFRACGLEPVQATKGSHLVELLNDNKSHVVTTLIHKFAAATNSRELKSATRNTFVLIDEGHRSQSGERHARMHLALKGACMVAFTGTPLAKDAKKNTFRQFGNLFEPAYTISKAVEDKAVLPLIYEARHVPQPVDQSAIDNWFDKLTGNLSDAQKADLKRKFSSEKQLNAAAQKIRMVAYDISQHYSSVYQGTGLKGQLVTPSKAAALEYKACFDEFSIVKTEVLISSPTEKEGEDNGNTTSETKEKETAFWDSMMARYGNEKLYNQTLINAFKRGEEPEIVIVVDKLLTGFDAPCNSVLYLTRKLKDHTLLQAIARVNRLYEGKEYGLIMDYSGVIEELDEAIDFYSQLANYDRSDLDETIEYVNDVTQNLPQLHSDVWELFSAIRGYSDPEAFEQHLRDQERRDRFYERFSLFARTLALALSSTTFLGETPESTIQNYKKDLKFFQNLRAAVAIRFQERLDFSEYEPKIKKLIDTHLGAAEVQQLCDPINLLNSAERNQVLEDQGKSADSKADTIAAATFHTIEREMDKDPTFYGRFSKLLSSVLDDLHAKRIAALDALEKIKDIQVKVSTHTDGEDLPSGLYENDMARRFYGSVQESLATYAPKSRDILADIAIEVNARLDALKIRDWHKNHDVLNRMRNEIDDILFDIAQRDGLDIPLDVQDALIDKCIQIAQANADS